MKTRLLVVDDEREMCALVVEMLRPRGVEVVIGSHTADILHQIDDARADVLLTDIRLPGNDGLALCRTVAAAKPDVPVVVMTGFGSLDNAIDAIRAGAYDFVTKPVDADTLFLVVDRAGRHAALVAELRRLRAATTGSLPVDGLVGSSSSMRRIRDLIAQVAELDVTVLLTGESGTGKEVAARALHSGSKRRNKPFVAVNCAALPEHLLESQLFGHVRGAFTDAKTDRTGLFLQAAGGTLLLDELAELPLALQPKLLRVVEERRVRPVGGEHELPIDVRLLVATNKNLDEAVAEGSFREDLFYRVNVIQIELPPVRSRGNDALELAHVFVERAAKKLGRSVKGISPSAASAILSHSWPGNVRELLHAMERAVALTQYDEIVAADLPTRPAGGPRAGGTGDLLSLEVVERRHVLAVLEQCQWSRRRAATILGIDPKTLYRKLVAWGVDRGRAP